LLVKLTFATTEPSDWDVTSVTAKFVSEDVASAEAKLWYEVPAWYLRLYAAYACWKLLFVMPP
jgi:hypothetical protein